MKLGNILYNKLIEKGVISLDVLEEIKQESQEKKIPVEDLLVEKKIISAEEITKIKSEIINIPYVNLSEKLIRSDIFNLLPPYIIENYKIIPFDKNGNEVYVGMVDPQNFRAVEAIEFLAKKNGFKVKYFIISENSFQEALKKYKSIGVEVKEALGTAEKRFISRAEEQAQKIEGTSDEIIRGAPISKIVSVIIKHAVEGKASDIHIEPGRKTTKVRYRVDGILHTSLVLPIYVHDSIVSRIKVMSNLKIDETRIPQDGRIHMEINGRQVDFRVSTLPLMGREKVVMRVLDTSSGTFSLEELGFNKRHVDLLKEGIKMSHGMLLVTGPTGSGKSTTLYSLLNMLNKEGVNIVTLEDPVEYSLEGINQAQVRPEVGFTFAAGLRSILRQDPDIIMVGEIRDNETAELAIHAGLTGHIVLSTLHTNDAYGAIPRLKDMHVEPFLLSSTLNVVLAQRLVRKVCPNCKQKAEITADVRQEVAQIIKKIPSEYIKDAGLNLDKDNFSPDDLVFYRGAGCDQCHNTGYRSRSVIAEILVMTPELRKIVAESEEDMDAVEAELRKQKMITLQQDGILKALQGITSLEEVMKATRD